MGVRAIGHEKIPAKVSGIIEANLSEDLVLFHPQEMAYYGLNASARLIWECIDGQLSVKGISQVLLEKFPDQDAQVETDVQNLVLELLNLDFLTIS